MTGWSLRRRLTGWLVLSLAVIGALALIDTRAEAIRTAQSVSDRILTGSALAVAEQVTASADGGLDVLIPFSALEMLSSAAQDRVFYRVDGPAGFLTGYADLPLVAVTADGPAFADATYDGTVLRIATLQRTVSAGDGPVRFSVTVAESTRAREALAWAILTRSALRLALLILAAAGVAWVATTLALRPLDRIGAAIAARQPDDLSPISAAIPREIGGLVGSINAFMARLDAAIGALRGFARQANHQVRTPLATARTQIALAARGTEPQALTKADGALVRAERVLAQLLLLAHVQAAGGRPPLGAVDLAQVTRQIATDLIPEAVARGQDLGFDGPDCVMVQAEPVLLGELIRNLADNAIRHSGPGSTITLRITAPGQLVVEDSGPGLPALPEPSTEGEHGLGLLIVRQIAEGFGATLTLHTGSKGHGLAVAATFSPA